MDMKRLKKQMDFIRLAKKITREEEEAAVREAVEELRKRKNQEKPLE